MKKAFALDNGGEYSDHEIYGFIIIDESVDTSILKDAVVDTNLALEMVIQEFLKRYHDGEKVNLDDFPSPARVFANTLERKGVKCEIFAFGENIETLTISGYS